MRDGSQMTGRAPLLAAFSTLLAIAACGPAPTPVAKPVPATGERYRVSPRSVPEFKPVAATITTRDMAEARARIGGTLARLSVKEGDLVRRGQVIGVVVDQRLGLETRAYDAQVQAAQAEATRAQADLGRTRDLFEHGVYAQAKLDQVQAASRAAAGNLNAARAQRAASAQTGAQGAILAPADGRVLRADVPAGSVVTPGMSVAQITAGPVVLRIEVPEAQAGGLRVGQTMALASEDLDAGGLSAVVTQVYPAVAGGRVVADLTAPGLDSRLVGRRMRARVQIGERQALVVPSRFVIGRFGVDYVRLLARDGSAHEAPVQTAPLPQAGEVEILSGLAPGDTLVAPGGGR
jgi:RND family efflux transporter MFP subunit